MWGVHALLLPDDDLLVNHDIVLDAKGGLLKCRLTNGPLGLVLCLLRHGFARESAGQRMHALRIRDRGLPWSGPHLQAFKQTDDGLCGAHQLPKRGCDRVRQLFCLVSFLCVDQKVFSLEQIAQLLHEGQQSLDLELVLLEVAA